MDIGVVALRQRLSSGFVARPVGRVWITALLLSSNISPLFHLLWGWGGRTGHAPLPTCVLGNAAAGDGTREGQRYLAKLFHTDAAANGRSGNCICSGVGRAGEMTRLYEYEVHAYGS